MIIIIIEICQLYVGIHWFGLVCVWEYATGELSNSLNTDH